jgi:hypothetical protein
MILEYGFMGEDLLPGVYFTPTHLTQICRKELSALYNHFPGVQGDFGSGTLGNTERLEA